MSGTNLRYLFTGVLLITILSCMAESSGSQEAKVGANQGGKSWGAELARGNSLAAHRRWPLSVDEAAPSVAPDVPCALGDVVQGASQRVAELVTNLDQFTATERVEHSELGKKGKWATPRGRSFKYLVSISEIRPGMLNVEENRNGGQSLDAFPTRLATIGLAASALIFHPYYVGDFEMACEGLGEWRGQPAWLVHFQQRSDKSPRIHVFRVGGGVFPVKQKGRAWISFGAYQILRLVLDLVEPVPKIRLKTEHEEIEYGPVEFRNRKAQLWLPVSADLFMDFRGHGYHHRHSFSDFLLFSVDATQEIQAPKEP